VDDWLNGYGWELAHRQWMHVQGVFQASSPNAADGRVTIWINGEKALDQPYQTRCPTNPAIWRSVWFGNFLGHGARPGCPNPCPDATTYWDDVYVDLTQSRVELGDQPVYDQCTRREIQLPTAWSAGRVTVTVNTGGFRTDDAVFIFVIDQDGTASAGYGPLVVGGVPGPGQPSQPVFVE
jgi:hypothetical protein